MQLRSAAARLPSASFNLSCSSIYMGSIMTVNYDLVLNKSQASLAHCRFSVRGFPDNLAKWKAATPSAANSGTST